MPLVQAKCTNCGANLEVDNTKDAAICPSCGTPFIVEKAIKNYNTTNNIRANVVNVYGGNGADFVIRAGTLLKYNGAATDVVIPNSVTRVEREAFEECVGLSSVIIPDSVISIGASAFSRCSSLVSVTIGNSVTSIEDCAFWGCSSLTNIAIPDSVTSIGAEAFAGCSALSSIIISNGVTSIERRAFSGCSSLTNVVIPNSVTSIESGAFQGCTGLVSVTIPNSVTSIGDDAFVGTPQQNKYEGYTYSESGNCYIATAVYGSYDCSQVWTLRRYRDNRLAKHLLGRAFIRCYYAISPHLVKWFGETKWFQSFWKNHLDKLVHRLKDEGVADTPYCDRKW